MSDKLGLLIDIDGVLINHEGQLISSSVKALNLLLEKGIQFVLVSNNIKYNTEAFEKMGLRSSLPISRLKIITPISVVKSILPITDFSTFFAIGRSSFIEQVAGLGLKWQEENADVFLLCSTIDWNEEKINRAIDNIKSGAKFYATGRDMTFYYKGKKYPSTGEMAKEIEYRSGKVATLIGKPGTLIMEVAADQFQTKPASFVIIGDSLASDIKWAQDHNLDAILITDKVDAKPNSSHQVHVSLFEYVLKITANAN